MEFGTAIPQWLMHQEIAAGRRDNVIRLIKAIEDAGYAYISVGDHIVHPGVSHLEGEDPQKVIYGDIFSVLTFYAAYSTKLRLAIGVLILPYRQPFQAAHAAATVDQLSGGRLILGVGSGYARVEFDTFGIPLQERGPMSDEYLDIMSALLSGETVTHKGRYYDFHEISLMVRPLQKPRPPIWVGGSGKRALERAINRGDVWEPIASGLPAAGKRKIRVTVTPRELDEELDYADEKRVDLGKPPLGIRLSASTAMRFVKRPEALEGQPKDVRDQLITGTGSAEQLVEQLNAYSEAGAQGVSMGLTSLTVDDCLRDIEIVATKIMPGVK